MQNLMASYFSQTDLKQTLEVEFVNRVNEVGVDLNRCVRFPHTSHVLQFVCGLGPRKAAHLLKQIRAHGGLIESREALVRVYKMGSVVYWNCAGFLKFDVDAIAARGDTDTEVLDGSRIHPEDYE